MIFFLFIHESICCWYSLEMPLQAIYNEYTQHMFSWKNKKQFHLDTSHILGYGIISEFISSI